MLKLRPAQSIFNVLTIVTEATFIQHKAFLLKHLDIHSEHYQNAVQDISILP